jgi:hypothetical protein
VRPIFPLTELETRPASFFGQDEEAPHLPEVDSPVSPLEATGKAMLPACATAVPRELLGWAQIPRPYWPLPAWSQGGMGLDLRVPVTRRFTAVPETEESAWQVLVVRHLALPDWTGAGSSTTSWRASDPWRSARSSNTGSSGR